MKTKSILLSLVALASGICALAQENDDMYFSSKDRSKINQQSREEVVMASIKKNDAVQTINPSDSYSARNENPDYVAGAKVGSNASAYSSYFNPNYQPTVNQSLYNNNCNCGYNNNYGYNNSYGYNRYGYGNPYGYGMNSFGIGYGMGYYGMGYGMGYGSMYGMGMYGYPYVGYGYSSYGYSTVAVNSSNDPTGPAYGRRPSRSSSSNNSYYTSTKGTGRTNAAYYNGGTRTMSNTRSLASNKASNYYNNAWKQSATNNRGSSWNNSSNTRGSTWNNSNSGWNNSNSGSRGWSNPSNNWGGGGRSSGGFSGGGGGGFSGGGGGGHAGGGGGHGRR
jgi:hypothetical protein